MDCTRYTALIEPLLDPDLDDGDALRCRDSMRAHARVCPACRERFESTALLLAHLNNLGLDAAPPGFTAQVLRRLQAAATRRRRAARCRVGARWGMGGAAVAGLLAWWVWKDASTGWLLVALGRVATWWYSWLHDVASTMRQTVPIDVPLMLAALWRAVQLVLEACVAPLVAGWLAMTAVGAALHARDTQWRKT